MQNNMTISCNPVAQPSEVLMADRFPSAGIVAKFSTIAGGAWIEENPTPYGTTRVWRFDDKGNAEWICLNSLKSGGDRWYGHQFKARDFVLC